MNPKIVSRYEKTEFWCWAFKIIWTCMKKLTCVQKDSHANSFCIVLETSILIKLLRVLHRCVASRGLDGVRPPLTSTIFLYKFKLIS